MWPIPTLSWPRPVRFAASDAHVRNDRQRRGPRVARQTAAASRKGVLMLTRAQPAPLLAGRGNLSTVAKSLGFAVGYLVLSYLMLRPVLSTYVIADDFEGPFAQASRIGPGLGHALSLGWHESFVAGDRTRVLGVIVANAFDWAWLWASSAFGVSIEHLYALVKLGALVLCAASAATFWWISARSYWRPVRWSTALLLTSVALFGTVQIHGLWSNDPVQSYPLAGYVSAAIGFVVLVAAVWASGQLSSRRFAAATVLALIAVSYYEFNAAAVLGGGIILVVGTLRYRGDRRRIARHLLGTAAFCLVPLVWLIFGRYTSVGDNYSGRALQSAGALHSFVLGAVGNLPGAAWGLETSVVGAQPPIVLGAVVAALVAIAAAVLWLWRDAERHVVRPARPARRTALAAAAAATGVYALGALALVSATVRVEGSTPRIGYVYTPYAVGSSAVALAIGVVAWVLATRRSRSWVWVVRMVAIAGAVAFVAVQNSYNLQLKNVTNSDMMQNHVFDEAFAGDVSEATRCGAILTWASYPWPDYYRSDVVLGSYTAYRHYYGQPFCANWTDPTDGFSEPFAAGGRLAWWMTQSSGAIEIETTGCTRGCRGVLSFAAAAFSVPHIVTLSVNGAVAGRVSVPTKPKRFSMPVRLLGTFTQLGVAANGHGVTPASVHVDADMRTLFVEIEQPRFVRST
jgi:hypothetical protein